MKIFELEIWLEEVYKIVTDLHISLTNAKRLTNTKYEFEEKIKVHGFFQHHLYQLRFIMAVQLAKLFSTSRNQKFNLNKMLEKVENELDKEELASLFDYNRTKVFAWVFRSEDELKQDIQHLKAQISNMQPIIKRVVHLRDKVYAHKDSSDKMELLSAQEVEPLINLSAEIYNTIRRGLFDKNVDFERNSSWNVDDIIRECSFARQYRKL